jgi:pyridoxine/pyridoxamine 5'-phosphate oxidase
MIYINSLVRVEGQIEALTKEEKDNDYFKKKKKKMQKL